MKPISWSELSTWENCPKLWYEKYVLKLESTFNPAFYFGGKVHDKLKDALTAEDGLTRDPTTLTYEELSKLDNPEAMASIGTKLIDKALVILDKLKFQNPILVEGTIEFPDYKGIVDLVFQSTTGKVHIVDWKTTSVVYQPYQIQTSGQLTGYAWLYYRKFERIPDFVHYITLNKKDLSVNIYSSDRSFDDLLQFEDRVKFARQQMNLQHIFKKESSCVNQWGTCEFFEKCWGTDRYYNRIGLELPRISRI